MKIVAVALAVAATSGWHVIGRSLPSTNAMTSDVAAHAIATRPHALAVRVRGGGSITGSAAVRCTRAGRTRATMTSFVGRFAVLKLPLATPGRCTVAARAAGTGQLTLEILAR